MGDSKKTQPKRSDFQRFTPLSFTKGIFGPKRVLGSMAVKPPADNIEF